MRSMTKQRGMTGIGWLIVLALIGFFVLLTLKIVPSYMEYYKVVATLTAMEKESGFSSPQEIRRLAARRFDISYVEAITPKDLKIKSRGKKFSVTAKYESRKHLFHNISVVMDFEKQVLVNRN